MCLVVLAWNVRAGRRLVLAGNRDEFHARPTEPMHWWSAPRLLAGRDLAAGGTWLGVDAAGRFGVVTNFRGARTPGQAPSRGTLIPRFLAGRLRPSEFLAGLAAEADRYAGFSLLLGDAGELAYLTNADARGPCRLGPGTYGLSNGILDAPWPKLIRSRDRLAARLAAAEPSADSMLDLLADRTPAADAELPDTGIGLERERALSAPFIVGPGYGTRSASAVLLDADGHGQAVERTHGPDGSVLDTRRFTLAGAAP